MHAARARLGIGGLFLFEALLCVYIVTLGAVPFALLALVDAILLAIAWWRVGRESRVGAPVLAGLAVVTLSRAIAQTPATTLLAIAPSYLVAVGFAIVAFAERVGRGALARGGLVLVGACRAWFMVPYFLDGAIVPALANLLGAAGALLWASAIVAEERPEEAPSARAA